MVKYTFEIPGFKGYSALNNRQSAAAADISNFEIRDSSLKTRDGATKKLTTLGAAITSLFLLKTKLGIKYYLAGSGANLKVANEYFTDWVATALKTDCASAKFDSVVLLNKLYMGNGTDMLVYDGTTLADISGSPPNFNVVTDYKNRIITNDLNEPTIIRYSGIGVDAPTTIGDNYMQVSQTDGDFVTGFIKVMTHLFILNEYSCYALYGTGDDDFQLTRVASIGTDCARSITEVNGYIFWLSQHEVYQYAGAGVNPVAFALGELSELINLDRTGYACAVGYKDKYILAIASAGHTGNDLVLSFDTIVKEWTIDKYAFGINEFLLDGADLYACSDDGNVYLMDNGTTDGGVAITSTWVSDALTFNHTGKKKKIKTIAVELGEVTTTGTINMYIKEGNGAYSAAYPITIPTTEPGITTPIRVHTGKFYNATIKLESTAKCVINKIAFGMKVKPKVK